MGTMKLLLNLRDVKKSLPKLSAKLGTMVRTNSEGLLGSVARKSDINYSEGVSISSIYNHDEMTRIEPVRYPDGSSLMRFLAAPLIDKIPGNNLRTSSRPNRSSIKCTTPSSLGVRITRPAACTTFCRPGYRYV